MSNVEKAEWRNHDERVRPYMRSNRILRWAKTALTLGLLWFLLFPARAAVLEASLAAHIDNLFLLWLAYFGVIGGASWVIGIPFDYGHQMIEKKYHLSKQNLGSWFGDKLKGLALGAVLGAIVMGLLFFAVRVGGELWWVVACTLFVLFSIVLAQLAPVLLIPIFFKLKPMENSPLKERLLKLCERFKIEVKDVYHLGLGEKTEKGNAAFVGLGRTKRIMIGDTLYEKYSAEEVEAVFAHELGHQVHNDLWKGIGLSAFLIYLSFFVAQWIAVRWCLPHFNTTLERPFGLFLFFIDLTIVQMPIGVIQAAYSRARERAADDFALSKIGVSAPLADALEKLTYQNFGYFKPNALVEFWSYSHPAPWRRITYLRTQTP